MLNGIDLFAASSRAMAVVCVPLFLYAMSTPPHGQYEGKDMQILEGRAKEGRKEGAILGYTPR